MNRKKKLSTFRFGAKVSVILQSLEHMHAALNIKGWSKPCPLLSGCNTGVLVIIHAVTTLVPLLHSVIINMEKIYLKIMMAV